MLVLNLRIAHDAIVEEIVNAYK